jgi:hypothetical protein
MAIGTAFVAGAALKFIFLFLGDNFSMGRGLLLGTTASMLDFGRHSRFTVAGGCDASLSTGSQQCAGPCATHAGR